MYKRSFILPIMIQNPTSRLLLGMGGGFGVGMLSSSSPKENDNMFLTPNERFKKQLTAGIRGALLGAGLMSIPELLGYDRWNG